MDTTIRFGVSLPPWFEKKLRIWAKVKGTNRATLAANILQSRIEDNWKAIEVELENIARENGITVEELISRWLNEGDE